MITKNDVIHIAKLARIHLREEEITHLTKDMESILDYIATLDTLDVTNVEPTSHVFPLKNVVRKDVPSPSLTQEAVLNFSVEQKQGNFKVPKVIE